MNQMWPFKKQSTIIVYCEFPKYTDKEDKEFIYRTLIEDLKKDFGNCYNIELYPGCPDNIILKNFKEGEIKARAIRINIYRRIRKCK